MITSTAFDLAGYRILAQQGLVHGIIVRSPSITQGVLGAIKSLLGGRIAAYTKMCEQCRHNAYKLMVDNALQLGANAVIGIRYDTSDLGANVMATEILCYGTAVIVEKF